MPSTSLPCSTRSPRMTVCAILACLFLLALSTTARAGTWNLAVTNFQYTAVYNGQSTGQTYSAPPPTTNSNPIDVQGPYASGGKGATNSASATLSFTLTGTWVPDPALPSDPAPPSVMVAVATLAQAYGITNGSTQIGTVNDGYGDTPDPHSGVAVGTHYLPQSGSISLSVSLSASVTGVTGFAFASTGPLTLSIHAQPYNLRLVPENLKAVPPQPVGSKNGALYFVYTFSSTDGTIANAVGNVSMYEQLDWSGNTQGRYLTQNGIKEYIEPDPPVNTNGGANYNITPDTNPFNSQNAAVGIVLDIFSPPLGGFAAPYPSASWHLTQNYVFDDAATGEKSVKIPGPGNHSPFTITRTVTPGATKSTGTYTISRDGYTLTKSLP